MSLENHFEVPEEVRISFINDFILGRLPHEMRGPAGLRVVGVVKSYVGCDLDVISILTYAAEQNRFDEFVRKLEEYHQKHLQYVSPEARRNVEVPGARAVKTFFLSCYDTLGISSHH